MLGWLEPKDVWEVVVKRRGWLRETRDVAGADHFSTPDGLRCSCDRDLTASGVRLEIYVSVDDQCICTRDRG
jgi:hypothetical protein